jgi:hypothetical protein
MKKGAMGSATMRPRSASTSGCRPVKKPATSSLRVLAGRFAKDVAWQGITVILSIV